MNLPLFPTAAPTRFKFRIQRAFKALDNGSFRKWVVVAHAKDLPLDLPLDANARVPNVLKNPTCNEMRETLLTHPQMFQIFNGGIVCTANTVEPKQEGNEHFLEITFAPSAEQGIVNGGHTYGTLLHVLQDNVLYSEGKDLRSVLLRKGNPELAELANDERALARCVETARERATVQIEFVAPVDGSDLLMQIARARNLSQGVEATAFANLAGKFDHMKEVLRTAEAPFGSAFVDRVVWKTNYDVPEGSKAIPVKLLIQLLALMNFRNYSPEDKPANEVYGRSGVVVREFSEAEGDEEAFFKELTKLLPEIIRLHDHIYLTLPETAATFPWADGKMDVERKRRRTNPMTPFLATPCETKVANAFLWPILASFRSMLKQRADGGVELIADPIAFYDEIKSKLAMIVQSVYKQQGNLAHQVGREKDVWIRLDGEVRKHLERRGLIEEK